MMTNIEVLGLVGWKQTVHDTVADDEAVQQSWA